jgi:hypothetical protein
MKICVELKKVFFLLFIYNSDDDDNDDGDDDADIPLGNLYFLIFFFIVSYNRHIFFQEQPSKYIFYHAK